MDGSILKDQGWDGTTAKCCKLGSTGLKPSPEFFHLVCFFLLLHVTQGDSGLSVESNNRLEKDSKEKHHSHIGPKAQSGNPAL